MYKLINKIHEKSELWFSLIMIAVYIVSQSIANELSVKIGIDSIITVFVNIIFTLLLIIWIKKRNLNDYYGLCKPKIKSNRLLWYIPLIIFTSYNLWYGVVVAQSALNILCYIVSMLCVGFLEEIIFRGFLFKALAKDNIKIAIAVSSVTFGIGHILNLFNGSGMGIVTNIMQIVGAIICGFVFVLIFYYGGSLIPCILAHGINNALSIFSNLGVLSTKLQILLFGINMLVMTLYAITICYLLSKEKKNKL